MFSLISNMDKLEIKTYGGIFLVENTLCLDQEWIELMLEARSQGFSCDEIRDFLKNPTCFK
ncbi:anti-repressor SinI family protein [Fictibacillus phosphorivorans]|uniref:anti-repressor SinI family protein n=1 Tax=Fictibacillus phosphorivorans TaxID=1221500 RepID=UPI0032E802FB